MAVRRLPMIVRGIVVAVAVSALAGCGPDASSAPSTASGASPATGAQGTTTPAPADFGSAYVGQPVAFWFWAPY